MLSMKALIDIINSCRKKSKAFERIHLKLWNSSELMQLKKTQVWQLHNFSNTQILREINFGDCIS